MSLRNDQSPEIAALDAFVEANRKAEVIQIPAKGELKAFATTLAAGTPVSVVKLSAREPWFDGLAALYCFNASRWDTPADLVYCFPNQAPAGSWNGTVVYVDFTALHAGTYNIVVSFGGANAVAHLRGPWGVVNKIVPPGSSNDTMGAVWTGHGPLWFTVTFSGQWLGQVAAVQIFEMT